jgi:cytochrome c7-like protein
LVVKVWRFPDQVVRLAVVFLLVGTALVLVRHHFVPKSFGKYGHFRADAIPAAAALEPHYAGAQACADCHEDEVALKATSYHRGVSCESCHGAAADHVDAPDEHAPLRPTSRDACLTCHRYLLSRPNGFPQVLELTHNPEKKCVTCHNPHDPTPPQTPSTCGACHAGIARMKAVSHHARLECTICHDVPAAHREDPRAHPAKKPAQREFCGQCHAKGAVQNILPDAEIPRVDLSTHGGRYVCWQCHYPHYPES